MTKIISIHPENPQQRLIDQVVEVVRSGGLIAYPTDSAYALGCHIGDKMALDRIRAIRQLDKHKNFTLMCRDLSELATYAKVNNSDFRTLKSHTPGAYTFILNATAEVPRRLMHPKRKTIGMRVPNNPIALAIMATLGEPIMSSSLILPGEQSPLTDPYDIKASLDNHIELVVDGGFCGFDATSVIDMTGSEPEIMRRGCGDLSAFEN
jgi:tRNA threonylcarbamoyl adenosine modification protein (Sua5/YciO/YrdC/YwlC family)